MSEQRSQTPRVFPWAAVTACLLLLTGSGLVIAGVFELVGLGWALLAAAAPCLFVSAVILRGLL